MATVNSNYTSPLSATLDKATGGTIDETMTDAIASNDLHCHGTAGYIGARAYSTAAQSVATATLSQVNLGGESYDSDPNAAMHDNVTLNPYIVVRTAGVYLCHVYCQFASNATGYREVRLRLSSGSYLSVDNRPAVNGSTTDITTSVVYLFAATDSVDVVVYQTSGGALDLNVCILTVTKL
jgi:hypothetical protein